MNYIKLVFFFSIIIGLNACSSKDDIDEVKTTNNDPYPQVLRASGQKIVDGYGKEVTLRGMAFGNEVWSNVNVSNSHHQEKDFQRLQSMGMNAIRFYLSYHWFEDDANPYKYKEDGFNFIDQNIAWAKKYGIYLILNIHVPQGGFQSNGAGGALWTDRENQKRLIALWQEIADRYKDESTIAGYDLLNEPHPTSSISQWEDLANEMVDSVRVKDQYHSIYVERLNAIDGNWSTDNGEKNFFKIDDDNIVYEFHFYDPFEYSHQLAWWLDEMKDKDGGAYPDDTKITVGGSAKWYNAEFRNTLLPEGNTDWTYFEGKKYTVTDENIHLMKPAIQAQEIGNGVVYFDDIVVKEYDDKGEYVRDVLTDDFSDNSEWYFWEATASGTVSLANIGKSDSKSFKITGTTSDANYSSNTLRFIPKKNYSYQISGWMKGENIPKPSTTLGVTGSNIKYRLDFETVEGGAVHTRNKAYLEDAVKRMTAIGKQYNAPMYLGEFGLIKFCFEDDKGGTIWVSDMLDILKEEGLHFTYHSYHEGGFGVYRDEGLPTEAGANTPLVNVFKQKLLE